MLYRLCSCPIEAHANQAEVFPGVEPIVVCVLDGYNVCILAFYQTGNGRRSPWYIQAGFSACDRLICADFLFYFLKLL